MPNKISIMRLMILPGAYLRANAKRLGIRYNNNAPYHSTESDTFSSRDLVKTDKLRRALFSLYISGLLKKSLYPLSERLGISYTHVFEEWNQWIEEKRMEGLFVSEKIATDKRIRNAMEGVINAKKVSVVSDFVKHLSLKYGKPDIAVEIAELVREDGEAYLQREGFNNLCSRGAFPLSCKYALSRRDRRK